MQTNGRQASRQASPLWCAAQTLCYAQDCSTNHRRRQTRQAGRHLIPSAAAPCASQQATGRQLEAAGQANRQAAGHNGFSVLHGLCKSAGTIHDSCVTPCQ
jgi:hypothetical protein